MRRVLGKNISARPVSTFVISRLDYCNTILAGLSQSTMVLFQRVQNAAVRMVKNSVLVIISQKHDVICNGFRSNIVSPTSCAFQCRWSTSAVIRATSPNSYLRRQLFQDKVDYALPAETAMRSLWSTTTLENELSPMLAPQLGTVYQHL